MLKEDYYKQSKKNLPGRTCWNIYPRLLRKVRLGKNSKILDAGCGEGQLSLYLLSDNLYGFDFSKKEVSKAKRKRYKKIWKRNIHKTGFKNKEFDETLCVQVFQYIKDPEKAFKELLRITDKRVIITSANFKWFNLKARISLRFRK